MKITSYDQAVGYLESFIGKVIYKIDPQYLKHHDPLERMRVLLSLLDNPQEKFKSVLVGGTSGKGSTAYLISHILKTADYKTGLTISPHLQRINERIQIDGKAISDEEFIQTINSLVYTIELMKKMEVGAPSYFEIIIAMAFLYFVQQKVDIAVVEVGMGGEFDATNTLYPLVAVLTNVSLDHTNILGGTVQKIAKTKAGIIKDYGSLRSLRQFKNFSNASVPAARYRSPRDTVAFGDSSEKFFHAKAPREPNNNLVVVTGVKQKSVIKIVGERCKKVGAELYLLRKHFGYEIKKETIEGVTFDFYTCHPEFISGSEIPKLVRQAQSLSDNRRQVRNDTVRNLKLSLLGKYQVENASLAIASILQLRKFGFKVSEKDIRTALKTAFFPGRFEIINRDIKILRYKDTKKNPKEKSPNILVSQYPSISVILDGAHNPTKMKAFLSTLKKLYPKQSPTSLKLRGVKKIFVIAFKKDKNIKGMLKEIVGVADAIIITEFHVKTDMDKNASAEASNIKYQISNIKYNKKIEVTIAKDSKAALDRTLKILKQVRNDNQIIIVVTGSLYLVGEIRNMLCHSALNLQNVAYAYRSFQKS